MNKTFESVQTLYDMQEHLQNKASGFIRAHADEHLDRQQLIARTMAYLQQGSAASDATLERATVRALTEYESRNQSCYIDVDETTAHQVAVRDPGTGAVRIFTVGDLMRLVKTPSGLAALPTPSKRAACAGSYL